jgi:murein DD-endopeptidase MepM/ murein hydrolase activator NlpD
VVGVRGRTLVRSVLAVVTLAAIAGPAAAAPSRAPGAWVWPLDGPRTVARAFDPPTTAYGPGHRGADLPGRPGQAVRAAGAGRISYAGLLAGRGVLVVVHGELRSTYEPVTATVQVGQQVAAGEVIGHLDAGHAGCAQACLHWGLRRGDVYLDPVRLVRPGPSRLLPVNDADPHAAAEGRAARPVASSAPRPARPPVQARRADEPAFALRAGDAASGGAALVALVAGLVLLRRPPRPPHRPATPAAVGTGPEPADPPAVLTAHVGGLVDLTSERHRRRPEVA